jgi:tetratricopeptide (TPR) repeat protein
MRNARQLPSAEHAKQLFEQALNMHQRGRLHEAEERYRAILRAYPEHPDCNHFLGVLRFQQGRNDEALKHISAALKLQPSNTAALANYALVLVRLGRLEQALASYDKALGDRAGLRRRAHEPWQHSG